MRDTQAAGRVLLICHNKPFGRAMAAAMQARFGAAFCGVLAIHRPLSRRQKLRRALRAVTSLWRRSGLERRVRRLEDQLERAAALAFEAEARPPQDWPSDMAVHLSANPNCAQSTGWLAAQAPDLIVVTGAPVLKPEVFGLPPLGTLNMHSSLLPAYRGTQAEFWQVLEQDHKSRGITVHFIDAGVDTGAIVLQQRSDACLDRAPDLSPQMLRTRNLLQALKSVPDAAEAVLGGRADLTPQGPGPKARRSRDRTLALRAALLRQLGYLSAPPPAYSAPADAREVQ